MFSVLILTLNEEKNILPCIASARGCDDIVVLDSGSTDRTCELARQAGARVLARPFDNFGAQRNHAHEAAAFRHPWVFHLDADERLSPELAEECAGLSREDPAHADGFHAAPRMLWRGHWLRRCTDFPAWQARFVHATRFRFIQTGHGQREAPAMRMAYLKYNYDHEMCGEGVEAWLAKHRRYARQEAAAALAHGAEQQGPAPSLLAASPLERRRALKRLASRLPARPLARFFYQYLLRGGCLDGAGALEYCRLLARYEGFIARETKELRRLHTP